MVVNFCAVFFVKKKGFDAQREIGLWKSPETPSTNLYLHLKIPSRSVSGHFHSKPSWEAKRWFLREDVTGVSYPGFTTTNKQTNKQAASGSVPRVLLFGFYLTKQTNKQTSSSGVGVQKSSLWWHVLLALFWRSRPLQQLLSTFSLPVETLWPKNVPTWHVWILRR